MTLTTRLSVLALVVVASVLGACGGGLDEASKAARLGPIADEAERLAAEGDVDGALGQLDQLRTETAKGLEQGALTDDEATQILEAAQRVEVALTNAEGTTAPLVPSELTDPDRDDEKGDEGKGQKDEGEEEEDDD